MAALWLPLFLLYDDIHYECPFTTIIMIFRFNLKKLNSWIRKFVLLLLVPFVGIGG